MKIIIGFLIIFMALVEVIIIGKYFNPNHSLLVAIVGTSVLLIQILSGIIFLIKNTD